MSRKAFVIGSAVVLVVAIVMVVLFSAFSSSRNDQGRGFVAGQYKAVPLPSSLVLKNSVWVKDTPVPIGADSGPAWVYTYTIPPTVALQGLQNDIFQTLKQHDYLITGVTFTQQVGQYSFQARDVRDTVKLYFLIGYNARALDGIQQPGNLVYVTAEKVD